MNSIVPVPCPETIVPPSTYQVALAPAGSGAVSVAVAVLPMQAGPALSVKSGCGTHVALKLAEPVKVATALVGPH